MLPKTCLKVQFSNVPGFWNTLLGQNFSFKVQPSEFVQILHNGQNHWLMVSAIGCSPGEIEVYDSASTNLTTSLKSQIASFLFTPLPCITVRCVEVFKY